jgi:hypothetical protein
MRAAGEVGEGEEASRRAAAAGGAGVTAWADAAAASAAAANSMGIFSATQVLGSQAGLLSWL